MDSVNKLIKLADMLDAKGHKDLADKVGEMIKKEASVQSTVNGLDRIVKVLLERVDMAKAHKYRAKIADKILDINALDLASKQAPATAAIGAAVTVIKNTLNGREPMFVRNVLRKLYMRLKI